MKRVLVVVVALALFVVSIVSQQPITHARLPAGYTAYNYASTLSTPRGLYRLPNNNLLVLERGTGRVTLMWDEGNKGYSSNSERVPLATVSGLNHAVVFILENDSKDKGHILASSSTTVYRWNYTLGSRSLLGAPEIIVNNIPAPGHATRTLEFDAQRRLYVAIGSEANVDKSPARANIVRFNDIWTGKVKLPINWHDGELYANGLRNEVGVRFHQNQIWGVENGVDNLFREDLGGDIHINNPCEEFNLLPDPNGHEIGAFYGYPFCWSEYSLPEKFSRGNGSQWCQPPFCTDSIHTDAWCADVKNVKKPALCMPAHTAPLDVVFYQKVAKGNWPVPEGDAFVSLHGSWNRQPPQGYKVLHVKFDSGHPVSFTALLEYQGPGDKGPEWPYRPVALQFADCGAKGDCLLVTSDASNNIIAIVHQ